MKLEADEWDEEMEPTPPSTPVPVPAQPPKKADLKEVAKRMNSRKVKEKVCFSSVEGLQGLNNFSLLEELLGFITRPQG